MRAVLFVLVLMLQRAGFEVPIAEALVFSYLYLASGEGERVPMNAFGAGLFMDLLFLNRLGSSSLYLVVVSYLLALVKRRFEKQGVVIGSLVMVAGYWLYYWWLWGEWLNGYVVLGAVLTVVFMLGERDRYEGVVVKWGR